jgi:hypothetical protein
VPDVSASGLTDRLQVVVVIRLIMSKRGRVAYGEAIDVETQVARRFAGRGGMNAAVRSLLSDAAGQGNQRPHAAGTTQR